MKIAQKSLECGFSMPEFGMGTWMMGGDTVRDMDNDGSKDAEALRTGLARGLTHIDTAELYAKGFAEEITGQAISSFPRENLFITSKVLYDMTYDGVLRACENTLKRLGTDYLDLYLIHKADENFALKDTIRAFNTLADQKMIRNMGVSNFAVERFKRAQAYADHKVAANQIHYNLVCREAEINGLLDYSQLNDVMIVAWRPLQKGEMLEVKSPEFDDVCRKYRKTRAQIAINWLLSQKNVVTMSTMRSEPHLDENLGALNFRMESDDIELLRRTFPGQLEKSPVVPLA